MGGVLQTTGHFLNLMATDDESIYQKFISLTIEWNKKSADTNVIGEVLRHEIIAFITFLSRILEHDEFSTKAARFRSYYACHDLID